MTEATILIIDDNVNLARGFAAGLAGAGYHVHVAHTAETGLDLAHREEPHAIILDFRMPFVNGLGFLYRLRQVPALREIPVMVVTGVTVNDETREELRDLRAVVRFKPIGLSELLAETDALLHAMPRPRLTSLGVVS